MKSSDPFALLKDLTTANAMQDKSSMQRQQYEAFMKKAGGLNTDQGEHDGFRGFGEGDFGTNLN